MKTENPKWVAVGNKVSFKYNVTWECSGEITNIDDSGAYTKLHMKDVLIDGESRETYIFHLPSIKQPSING